MPVRNQNWYDLQAGRKYPLEDTSTGLDDSSVPIRDDIIVDCHIRVPETFSSAIFIQAITITNNIVTVLLGGVTQISGDVTSIAALSLPKPVDAYVNYAITPLVSGVAGWLVFGPGVSEPFSGRYATAAQTKLAPRNAATYAALPVNSLSKQGLAQTLDGVISITCDAPIVAEKQIVDINGKQAVAVVFKLDAAVGNFDYNPLAYFLGPCGMRPESGTCPSQPIETINGVAPDCNGNINIVGIGVDIYPFTNCGGFGVDVGLGLADACRKTPYGPPREPQDNCEPGTSSSSTSATSTSSSSSRSSSSTPAQNSSASSSSLSAVMRTLPVCEPFTAPIADVLTVQSGAFALKIVPVPAELEKCSAPTATPTPTLTPTPTPTPTV
jgi:hypothetical protein